MVLSEDFKKAVVEALARSFSDVTLEHEGGHTSLVFRGTHRRIETQRAIKVLRPEFAATEAGRALIENEVKHLGALQHAGVVTLFDVGELAVGGQQLPYYVMEFLDPSLHFTRWFRERGNALLSDSDGEENLPHARSVFVDIFRQAIAAVAFLHESGCVHTDLKPANILVVDTKAGARVKVADFGYSKARVQDSQDTELKTTIQYAHRDLVRAWIAAGTGEDQAVIRIPRNELRYQFDVHALGKTLKEALVVAPVAKALGPLGPRIESVLDQMLDDHGAEYEDAAAALIDFDRVAMQPSLQQWAVELEPVAEQALRVPELLVPFTERVRRLVDLPVFQRLRGLKQMGLGYLAYPGAVHTRFEHSLGVFALMAKVLAALLRDNRSTFFRKEMGSYEIRVALAAALCHDLGHYPFAHHLDEIMPEEFDHARISRQLIMGADAAQDSEALVHLLRAHDGWGVDPADVAAVLGGRSTGTTIPFDKVRLLHQLIDSGLDVDKMDYLQRDGHHAGVDYGKIIEEDRFMRCLSVEPSLGPNGRPTLVVTEKGRIAIELLGMAKYAMHTQVYQHHTVRAGVAMLHEAVGRLLGWAGPDARAKCSTDDLRGVLARHDDDGFLRWLRDESDTDVGRMVDGLVTPGRHFHRRLLLLSGLDSGPEHEVYEVFKRLRERHPAGPRAFQMIAAVRDEFCRRLRDDQDVAVGDLDILIDFPWRRDVDPLTPDADVLVQQEHAGTYVPIDRASPVAEAVGARLRSWLWKVRVFAAPDRLPLLRQRLEHGNPILEALLKAVYSVLDSRETV